MDAGAFCKFSVHVLLRQVSRLCSLRPTRMYIRLLMLLILMQCDGSVYMHHHRLNSANSPAPSNGKRSTESLAPSGVLASGIRWRHSDCCRPLQELNTTILEQNGLLLPITSV
jgi:hypothetical protein